MRAAHLDDQAEVHALAALLEACRRVDAPFDHPRSVEMVLGELRYGWDLEPDAAHVALEDGTLVAHGSIYTSEWDNKDLAWLGVHVHPDHRGRGIGTQVMDYLEELAGSLGRTLLGTDAWDGSTGAAFATARGYQQKSQAIMRRQVLADIDAGHVRTLLAEAMQRAGDYELLRVRGAMPEEMLTEFCEVAASINDAPLDDLELEDDVYEPRRMRDHEQAMTNRRQCIYRVLARHRGTGELGGHTSVTVERWSPTVAHQEDTAVTPAHRGHRLGLALKADMLVWLAEEEPQLLTVDTWNTESNEHMIAINEVLGYRVLARELQFQKRLG
jgi:GNAT superfamily N-acetyltransferase